MASEASSNVSLNRGAIKVNVLCILKGVCRYKPLPRETSKHCHRDTAMARNLELLLDPLVYRYAVSD